MHALDIRRESLGAVRALSSLNGLRPSGVSAGCIDSCCRWCVRALHACGDAVSSNHIYSQGLVTLAPVKIENPSHSDAGAAGKTAPRRRKRAAEEGHRTSGEWVNLRRRIRVL